MPLFLFSGTKTASRYKSQTRGLPTGLICCDKQRKYKEWQNIHGMLTGCNKTQKMLFAKMAKELVERKCQEGMMEDYLSP